MSPYYRCFPRFPAAVTGLDPLTPGHRYPVTLRYHPSLLSGHDQGSVMAPSTAERQRTPRRPVRGSVGRIDLEIPVEVAAKLGYLAHYWCCTRRAAFARLLMDAWEREGRPIPGYDDDGNPLPGHQRLR